MENAQIRNFFFGPYFPVFGLNMEICFHETTDQKNISDLNNFHELESDILICLLAWSRKNGEGEEGEKCSSAELYEGHKETHVADYLNNYIGKFI